MKRSFDRRVRLGGAALIVLATLALFLLPTHRGDPAARPSVAHVCLAFFAVCAGSAGATFLCLGRRMFEPTAAPRDPRFKAADASARKP